MPNNEIAVRFFVPTQDDIICPDTEPQIGIADLSVEQKSFKIRLADTEEGRNSASMLIDKMYSWRGYAGNHKIQQDPNRITLTASDQATVIGTITLSIDSPIGILADEIFKDQIDVYRNRGGKVCELIKLAFDPNIRSKMAMASLFHVAFIYGRYLHKCTDVFIEVNPRHRRFYERMLGFARQGDSKTNPRVNAPAFLLWVNLDHVEQQIEKLGGTSSHPGTEKSLYPYFFSKREEEGIVNRLLHLG
ncbi:MAG: GNAT family N-acetyltransferase [Pseudomonadota bacterium]